MQIPKKIEKPLAIINTFYSFFGQKKTIMTIAFISGFMQTMSLIKIIKNPIFGLLCGILLATIYTFSGNFLAGISPVFFKPIISFILIISIIYNFIISVRK